MATLSLGNQTIFTQSGSDAPVMDANVNLNNVNFNNVNLNNVIFPQGFPIKVTHFQGTETQQVYGTANYDYYNDTYTTNANQNTKLLIQYGIWYEMNAAGDMLEMAVSLDGTDIGVYKDTQSGIDWNIWTTAQTITSDLTKNTGYTIRVYIKSITGNVVVPRNGASPNWTLTITEIAA